MRQTPTFKAPLQNATGPGSLIKIPFDVEKIFGLSQVKVLARIDGVEFVGKLVKAGGPDHVLGLPDKVLLQIGKKIGEMVEVRLRPPKKDPANQAVTSKEVVPPPELKWVLDQDRLALSAWETLGFDQRRDFAKWVFEAQEAETRAQRAQEVADRIKKIKEN